MLRAMLGPDRLRVYACEDRGFRVEGMLTLALNVGTARVPEDTGRLTRMVAGEGFEPPTSGL